MYYLLLYLLCLIAFYVYTKVNQNNFADKNFKMPEDGEEFIVDKILDKRSRNGKIEYFLSWKVSAFFSNSLFLSTLFLTRKFSSTS